MTMLTREPGTYRAKSGSLVHLRAIANGTIVLEREDGARHAADDDDLVKLSDDPEWPDLRDRERASRLFID